jgi:uncharacterized membrane protein
MRLFGHPVHPMLVAFPLALLTLTPVLDVMAWTGLMADAKVAAYLCELAGLVGAGLSILTGFIDLVKIPSSENATVRTALIHAALALGTVSLFGIAFAVRGGRAASPGVAVLALEAAGAACVAATGWFGGHLVFRYGVGVGAPPKATGPFS